MKAKFACLTKFVTQKQINRSVGSWCGRFFNKTRPRSVDSKYSNFLEKDGRFWNFIGRSGETGKKRETPGKTGRVGKSANARRFYYSIRVASLAILASFDFVWLPKISFGSFLFLALFGFFLTKISNFWKSNKNKILLHSMLPYSISFVGNTLEFPDSRSSGYSNSYIYPTGIIILSQAHASSVNTFTANVDF